MKQILLGFLSLCVAHSAGAAPPNPPKTNHATLPPREEAPETWKNNPDFNIVYRVKRDIYSPLKPDTISFKTGDLVIFSRVSNELRGWGGFTHYCLMKASVGRNEDTPGNGERCSGHLPCADFNDALEPTSDVFVGKQAEPIDSNVPNVKPNFSYGHNFPVTVYPAKSFLGERPRLILGPFDVRIVTPSPDCQEGEFTVRIVKRERHSEEMDEEYRKIQKRQPTYAFAGPSDGVDFCIPIKAFVAQMKQYKQISPTLSDIPAWEDFSKNYYSGLSNLASSHETVTQISPFSEKDKKSGRSGPAIKMRKITSLPPKERAGLPNDAWVVEYGGPLYYACSSGSCRAQGYQIAVGSDGKLLQVLKNRLYYWNGGAELLLDEQDIKRLVGISNDKDQLKLIHRWAKGEQPQAFNASMSKLSEMKYPKQAGNSFGTFVLHLSKVREQLKTKNKWPIYDGAAPGGEE